MGRVSGPLIDRIDLHLHIPPVPFEQLAGDGEGSSSAQIKERVSKARRLQEARFEGVDDRVRVSGRSYHRILKVLRAIADLDGAEEIRCRGPPAPMPGSHAGLI